MKRPGEQMKLPGMDLPLGDFQRDEGIAAHAKAWTESQGRQYNVDPEHIARVRADPDNTLEMGRAVERQHAALQDNRTPEMAASFRSLTEDIEAQHEYMTRPEHQGGMGIKFEVADTDPYPTPMHMIEDVQKNKRIKVLPSGEGFTHDYLTSEQNDKFRGVHDVFGHAGSGRNFNRHGEEGAFQSHAAMMRPGSLKAMASELRGQNSALITSGDFLDTQAAFELPERFNTAGSVKPPPKPMRRPGEQLRLL